MENEIVSGQQSAWSIIKKLGEGDAGEVYLVESLVGGRVGVLKRPQKSAFTGDVLRQATQIKNEGQILKVLSGINLTFNGFAVKVPDLLDQSKPGNDFSDRLFIITEKAPGLDLSFLSRTGRMGVFDGDSDLEDQSQDLTPAGVSFLNTVAENGHIPDRILLTCLVSLLETLHFIHLKPVEVAGSHMEGFIYNDIKPEHLFWNPDDSTITLIDWGNAQFATTGGLSRDRQYTTRDDYRQFIEGIGSFLSEAAPDLRRRLEWPENYPGLAPAAVDPDNDLFQPGGLSDRLLAALKEENTRLSVTKERQQNLLQPAATSKDAFLNLQQVHKELLSLGETPDYLAAIHFAAGYATNLVLDGDLGGLQEICEWVVLLPCPESENWRLISRLAQIASRIQGELRQKFLDTLQAAICDQGEIVLWKLISALQDLPEPNWWHEVVSTIRHLETGVAPDTISLFVAVNRLALALQVLVRQTEDNHFYLQNGKSSPTVRQITSPVGIDQPGPEADLPRLQRLYNSLQEDIIANWTQIDPPPPHALLDYSDFEALLQDLAPDLAAERQLVEQLLEGARLQVRLVLDAWEQKEFSYASRALRNIILWDPDRKRVLWADQLILSAPEWLKKVHRGPSKEELFSDGASWQEFATDLEFEGRELRNHVGPATWLDEILDSLARLRKGVWPADLLTNSPNMVRELPWLKRFERIERLPPEVRSEEEASLTIEMAFPEFSGTCQGVFGPKGEMRLLEPLDAWLPEARGSSARVYLGELATDNGVVHHLAVKLMRMDKVEYALPLFKEEVEILSLMDHIPGINRMLECGFIHLTQAGPLPTDGNLQAVRGLEGDLMRIGPDSIHRFISQLEMKVEEGWIPYLGIEIRQKEDNLLLLCDAGLTNGKFLPLVNLLQMVIQICDILEAAHRLNIVYRDHKILHYYWQESTNGIYLIDWNVARLHRDGLSDYEKKMDLVQFGARGLHHILTGRAAPGALPLGPTRPDEIDHAAETYNTQWTYDDQRLSSHLRGIIEAVLAGKYSCAGALRDDLKGTFITL